MRRVVDLFRHCIQEENHSGMFPTVLEVCLWCPAIGFLPLAFFLMYFFHLSSYSNLNSLSPKINLQNIE